MPKLNVLFSPRENLIEYQLGWSKLQERNKEYDVFVGTEGRRGQTGKAKKGEEGRGCI